MSDKIFFQRQNAVFNKLIKDIKEYSENLIEALDAEMGASVEQMATEAKRLAPVDTGRLRGIIKSEKDPNKKLSYNLTARVNYAPYVEFGTGPYAKDYVPQLPPDWQEYAKDFRTRKPGHTRQQPFFYPSVNKVFPVMIQRMENIIKENEG